MNIEIKRQQLADLVYDYTQKLNESIKNAIKEGGLKVNLIASEDMLNDLPKVFVTVNKEYKHGDKTAEGLHKSDATMIRKQG